MIRKQESGKIKSNVNYSKMVTMNGEFLPKVPLRLDEQLTLIDWPQLEPIYEFVLGSADCLMVAAGFENRALAGLERACKMSLNFHVVSVQYLPKIAENKEEACRTLCKENDLDVKEVCI